MGDSDKRIDPLASGIFISHCPKYDISPTMGSLISMLSAKSDAPPYRVICAHFDPKRSFVTIMCNVSQIQVSVERDKLRSSRFEQEFDQLISNIGNNDDFGDDYDAFCDWILAPCLSSFQNLALFTPNRLTLEAFCDPPIYSLELEVVGGGLVSKVVENSYTEKDDWFTIPSAGIPSFEQVPHIKASDLLIVPSNNTKHEVTCDIPELVQRNDGNVKFFKPAFESSGFIREVNTQDEISAAGLHNKAKVSKMCGIVVSNDQSRIIGLLLDLIPSMDWNSNLCSGISQVKEYWMKWERQVDAIIKMLHTHNIVWGDADPSNVVIDKNFDAWVVDFGGKSVDGPGYGKHPSKDGDLHGVEKIFRDLTTMRTMR